MEFFIACGPEEHPVIPGTGGFRKARWARPGKGKSGGYRVIYCFLADPGRIYMAAIYAKSRQATLSAADEKIFGQARGADQESGQEGLIWVWGTPRQQREGRSSAWP